jgi:hypothetical protein
MRFQDDNDSAISSADDGMFQKQRDPQYSDFSGNELHCLGIVLDTVLAVVRKPRGFSIEFKVDGLVPGMTQFCTEHEFATYDDVAQVVVAMLHGDVPPSWRKRKDNPDNATTDYPDEQYVCIPNMSKRRREESPNASRHVPVFGGSYDRQVAWEAVCTIMRGRKAFITQKGYDGLMPEYVDAAGSTQEGDSGLQLAIFATCSVLGLLQEDPTNEGRFRLLGTCFVQGWMEGEILKEEMGCETPD